MLDIISLLLMRRTLRIDKGMAEDGTGDNIGSTSGITIRTGRKKEFKESGYSINIWIIGEQINTDSLSFTIII